MTDIYIDASASTEPDAAERLGHLLDDGHRLILLGDRADQLVEALPVARRAAALPDDPPRGSWYLTADPATCAQRRPGLRTMLIGPRVAAGTHVPRCDAEARDLAAAVLEVLSRDAMG